MVVTVALTPSRAGADLPPTGSIVFTGAQAIIDTRWPLPATKLAAGADQGLPSGVLSIAVFAADTAGMATVLPCGAGWDPMADFFIFDASAVARTLITTDVGYCLRATVAVHVLVVKLGDLHVPSVADGLQYHALPTPQVVLDQEVNLAPTGFASTDFPVASSAAVPSTAASVVYRIDADATDTQFGLITTHCGDASNYYDYTVNEGSTSTIAYRQRAASEESCLRVQGNSSGHVTVTVLGWLEAGGPDPTAVPPELWFHAELMPPPGLEAVSPTRVLDTRNGIGSIAEPLHDDEVLVLDLNPYITDFTASVVMNVTVTNPVAAGFVTVFPCDVDEIPNASNLNFVTHQDVPNLVSVPIAFDGTVCMVTSATTDLIADLAGTYEFGGGSLGTAVAPDRILDTRTGNGAPVGKLGAGQTLTLQVAGRDGLPASGMTAVTMNVTVTGPELAGFVTVFPCDQPLPNASNLNFAWQRDVPNLVTVKVSPTGTVCLTTTAKTHLIADVAMWFGAGGGDGFYDIAPTRIFDTRHPSPLGWINPPLPISPGMPFAREVVASTGTSLADVHAVVMNVTVTRPFGNGFLTVHPCDTAVPNASNLNFIGLQNVPNLVVVKTSAGNMACFSTTMGTDIIADVAGYFTSAMVPFWDYVLVD